jgi:hypothetical protein
MTIPAAVLALALAGCDEAQAPTDQPARNAAAPASQPAPAPQGSADTQLSADMDLMRKVKQELETKQVTHVEVAANGGVVTLYGTVAGAPEKERVALLAMGVQGVRSVVNNLVVVQGS